MKITKYPQSCLLIENDHSRILIDPGNFVTKKYAATVFGRLDGVIYTHSHPDHMDEALAAEFRNMQVPLYGNHDVAQKLEGVEAVQDGQELKVAEFRLKALDLPHCKMVDGSDGPPNTGFLVDGRLFHPGDGIDIDGLRAEVLAGPIAGPSISFHDTFDLAKKLGAKTVIPIHYDAFLADPENFKDKAGDFFKVVVLKEGESAEV